MADLYTITLKNGKRYVTRVGHKFTVSEHILTGPPNIERSAIEEKLGMDVATLEVTIEASATDTINGVPMLQAIGQGLLRRRGISYPSLVHGFASNEIGTVVRFSGFIGALDELTRLRQSFL